MSTFRNEYIITDLNHLCDRLAVFVVFRGEFLSVKFIETRIYYNLFFDVSLLGPRKNRNKIEMKSGIGLCTILLIKGGTYLEHMFFEP